MPGLKHDHTNELRFYRMAMISLLSILVAVATWIATTTVTTSSELPAIKYELNTLNSNFEKLSYLPVLAENTRVRVDDHDRRIAWLEKPR